MTSQVGATSDLSWNAVVRAHAAPDRQLSGLARRSEIRRLHCDVARFGRRADHDGQRGAEPRAAARLGAGRLSGRQAGFHVRACTISAKIIRSIRVSTSDLSFAASSMGSRRPVWLRHASPAPQANAGVRSLNQLGTSVAGYLQINYAILPNLDLDLGRARDLGQENRRV